MSKFNVIEYRTALMAVQECVQEMDEAVAGLQFEHGDGGISSRAIAYLNQLNTALEDASKKQAAIGKLIVKEMAKHD